MPVDHHAILLVEDNQAAREALAEMLRLAGFDVVEASDGAEALTHLRGGFEPCVILLDLLMPGVDGYRFREQQLRDPALATIPVIAISGAGHLDQRAADLAIRDFITKPIDTTRVLDLITQYCRRP